MRAISAGAVGALLALSAAVVIVAALSASVGVPALFDPERTVAGWEGAQYGVVLFVLLGLVQVWPLVVIATLGAGVADLMRHGTAGRPTLG